MNIKMTTINNYQQLNLKNKHTLSNQLEQEDNHMEGYQWGGGREEWGKVTGNANIIGR